MRGMVSALAGLVALAPLTNTPVLASDSTDALATVKQYNDAFNNNDMKSWNALCADQAAIIDDFPPHVWQGANACGSWWNAFVTASKNAGFANPNVALDKPWHVAVEGDRAYVVEPAVYSYKVKGKPAVEHGVWTFALQRQAAGWRITGWAWAQH